MSRLFPKKKKCNENSNLLIAKIVNKIDDKHDTLHVVRVGIKYIRFKKYNKEYKNTGN